MDKYQVKKSLKQIWADWPAPPTDGQDMGEWSDYNHRPHHQYNSHFDDEWEDGQIVVEDIDFDLMDVDQWYWCKCEQCGWEGSSGHTAGGGPIGDTGDYFDPLCPRCGCNKLDGDSEIDTEYIPAIKKPTLVAMPMPTPAYRSGVRKGMNGWQAWFAIDHQTFYLQPVSAEKGDAEDTEEKARWYERNLIVAFSRLLTYNYKK